jgi:hypothetical protein
MKKLSLYIFLILLWCNFASASKSLNYGKYKVDPNNESFIEHVLSVESGMSWMQTWSKQKVYCKPAKMKMYIDVVKNAIELGVEELKLRNFSSQKIDDAPVEVIMLSGFEKLFPCN